MASEMIQRRARLGMMACLLWLWAPPAGAQLADQALTIGTSAVGLSSAVTAIGGRPVQWCGGVVEGGAIRVFVSGATPTSSTGIPVQAGQWLEITGPVQIRAFRAIRSGDANATWRVTCSTTGVGVATGAPPAAITLEGAELEVGAQPSTAPHHVRGSDGTDPFDLASETSVAAILSALGAGIDVSCVSGCAGGTQDADDGSIAGAQTTGLSLALNQVWDGSVWRRLTFGTAGTASSQVLTVQGIASMTPLSVTFPSAQAVTQSGPWTVQPGNTANTTAWLVTGTGGTFPATQSGNWAVRLQDGAGNALTSLSAGSQRAITVSVVDSGGNQVSSFGGSGGTASAFGSAFPSGASSGTASGFFDGTNMQGARVIDADTGAGTFWALGVNNVFRTDGTPVEAGTSTNPWNVVFPSAQAVTQSGTWNIGTVSTITTLPALAAGSATIGAVNFAQYTPVSGRLPVDGSGVTQPVSGTVTANQGGSWAVTANAGTNLNTSALLTTSAFEARIPALGQAAMAASVPVAIASNQGTLSTNIAQMNGVTVTMGNGASGTGVQRVTLANDSTGVLESVGAISTSVTPGTAATNLGKAEDAAHTTGDVGVMALSKRTDTAASSAGTDGDYATLNTDANGRLWSNIFGVTQAAGTFLTVRLSDGTNYFTPGSDYTHDAALTIGSTAGPVVMGRASASAPTNVSADNDAVAAWMTRAGAVVTQPSINGTFIGATGTSMNVACTSGCSGGVQYLEDTAHVSGDSLTIAGAVRRDTASSGVNADGDYATINVDANGRLYTQTVGSAAHDAAGTAIAPVLFGGYSSQAAPSDVSADGDVTRAWFLRNGAQAVSLTSGGTILAAGTGAASSALRVAFADSSTTAVTNAGTFAVQAAQSGTWNVANTGTFATQATLQAGTAVVGSLARCGDPASVQSVAISTSSSGYTQLVALSGSTVIHVCGFNVMAGGTTNVSLAYGTGSSCGTGTTALTGAYPLIAQTGLAVGNGGATQMKTAAGNALCVNNSAAVAIAGFLTYVQF